MALEIGRQRKLLLESIKTGVALRDILHSHKLSYEDLRYRVSAPPVQRAGPALSLADIAQSNHGVPTVSFFSGAGGLDLGFECAGFTHTLSLESNEVFCETLRTNRPQWSVLCEDVSNRDRISTILAEHISAPFDGIFHGGPPCQPFSIAANQRFPRESAKFKRKGFDCERLGNLLFDFVYYIVKFKPLAFVIENVPGLLDVDQGAQLQVAAKRLKAAGYELMSPTILNARDHGVPQDRSRLIVVGFRKRKAEFVFPEKRPLYPCGALLRNTGIARLPNHETREHRADSILRYMELECGQREPKGRVDRLDPCLPAKTVIAGGSGGGGRSHLHPDVPRTLSPRETAILQTFPNGYVFCGPPARQLNQVGNAVPPILAAQIAHSIAAALGVPFARRRPTSKQRISKAAVKSRG